MMKIIILGGSSDIGKALVEKLKNDNEIITTYFSQNPFANNNVKSLYLDISSKDNINEFINKTELSNWDCLIFLSASLKPVWVYF